MLEHFPALADIPNLQAAEAWLLERGELRTLAPGERYLTSGEPIDHMGLVFSGTLELMLMNQSDRRMHLAAVLHKGDITGVLPYSRLSVARGQGTARESSELFLLHRQHFRDMIVEQPELTEALVHHMTTRVRDFTREDVQSEKLSALGRMAAGLAHELNNPAAALRSLSQEVSRKVETLIPAIACLPQNRAHRLGERLEQLCDLERKPVTGLAKARALRELEDWLEVDLGLPNASMLAGDLTDLGYDRPILSGAVEGLEAAEVACLLELETIIQGLRELAGDMCEASGRIIGLVQAVKDFSHMDQAQETEPVDLAASVATTLRLMEHKARTVRIEVVNDIPSDLPKGMGQTGELSQVWTNLIDNALYAAVQAPKPPGKVTLTGGQTGERVWIAVEDNGPGVPAELQSRIFEPFFTTKKVGEGTGLGLELVRRIVDKAGGEIKVESELGRSVFTVYLPVAVGG